MSLPIPRSQASPRKGAPLAPAFRTCGWLLALALGAVSAPATVHGQEARSPEPSTGAAEIQVGGRVQTQFNTTTAEDEPRSELFLRRVRLGVQVQVNDRVSGQIEADFAESQLSLRDAYFQLELSPGFRILAGQAFLPFSLLEQTSSRRILPIERNAEIRGIDALDHSELISGLRYSDRDVGVQVTGSPVGGPLGLEYAAGVFRGPVQGQVGARDSYQYAARATVAPLPRVRVGGGWSSRHFFRESPADVSTVELRRGSAWEVDIEYGTFDPGIHLLGEIAFGDFDPFGDVGFFGAQAWLGYRTPPVGILSAVEPILRASYGSVDQQIPEDDGHGGTLLTPGLNLYFGGWNRFMVNYDLWSPDGARGREGSFKAQLQLVF